MWLGATLAFCEFGIQSSTIRTNIATTTTLPSSLPNSTTISQPLTTPQTWPSKTPPLPPPSPPPHQKALANQTKQLPGLHLRHGARQSELLLLLQDRRVPARRPLQPEARQTLVLPDDPAAEPVPESRVRPEEQDEPVPTAEPLRRLLRGFLVRDVQVRRAGGGGGV